MTDDQNDNNESIYSAPQSDTSHVASDNLLASYVGPKNQSYYLQKFDRFEAGGGSASWHWPAFFISSIWLLYRKMWLWALLYILVVPIGIFVVAMLIDSLFGTRLGEALANVAMLLFMFIFMPVFANSLYYRHAQAKAAKVAEAFPPDAQAAELERIGGTSKIVYVVVPLFLVGVTGMLAAIAIPAYQDYIVRAQVSEGLNLAGGPRAAVVDFYADNQRLPADNAEAGLNEASAIYGQFVESVTVIDGEIAITYGGNSHELLHGNALFLTPEISSNSIDWQCSASGLEAKHLPAACR